MALGPRGGMSVLCTHPLLQPGEGLGAPSTGRVAHMYPPDYVGPNFPAGTSKEVAACGELRGFPLVRARYEMLMHAAAGVLRA